MSNKEQLNAAIDRFERSWELLKDTFAGIAELISDFFRKLFRVS